MPFVQRVPAVSGNNVASLAVTVPSPAIGDDLFFYVSTWHGTTADPQLNTPADNQAGGGNTYEIPVTVQTGTAGGHWAAAIVRCRVTVSSGTFTVTFAPKTTSGNYIEVTTLEWIGTQSAEDQIGVGSANTTGTNPTATAANPNTAADRLVMVCATISAPSSNVHLQDPPPGFTSIGVQQDSNTTIGHQASYKVVSAIETSTVTWTSDSAKDGWAAVILTWPLPTVSLTSAQTLPAFVQGLSGQMIGRVDV